MTQREKIKKELAFRLRVPVSDILDRREAANLLGVGENAWTNLPQTAPNCYQAELKPNGYNLYVRQHLLGSRAAWKGLKLRWPDAPESDTLAFIKGAGADDEYADQVMNGWK